MFFSGIGMRGMSSTSRHRPGAHLMVRLSVGEKRVFQVAAGTAGLSLSAWVRRSLLSVASVETSVRDSELESVAEEERLRAVSRRRL